MRFFYKLFDFLKYCTPLGGLTRYRILKEVGRFLGKSPRDVLLTGRNLFDTHLESVYDNLHILCRYAYVSVTPLKTYDPLFDIVKGGVVLDFGSGIGICFDEIRNNPNYEKVFLDIPGPAFDYVHYKYDKCTFLNAYEAKLEKETYDLIVITDVLEHLENPVEVFSMVLDAVKKGGHLLYLFNENVDKPGHLKEAIAQKPVCDKMLEERCKAVCRLKYINQAQLFRREK